MKKWRGKKCSCRWRVTYGSFRSTLSVTQVWGQPGCQPCHRSPVMAPLTAGPMQTPSAAAHCPTHLDCSSTETTAGCIQGSISGVVFSLGKTLTCNYAAVQITEKAGIRKHRKAVAVYNGEIQSISPLQNKRKYLNTFSSKLRKYWTWINTKKNE